jgi:hypothetical protein
MPLYDARETVRYGAESTVLGSSLSILFTEPVTVMGRERVQVDEAERLMFGVEQSLRARRLGDRSSSRCSRWTI